MMGKIYCVRFKEPVNGEYNYHFGSIAAIYEVFTPEQIGCRIQNLWNYKLSASKPYKSQKCVIFKGELIRKQTERGKRNE
jgi:hypothetical protein